MLASAVFYGALLDVAWWDRWLEAAQRGPRVADGIMWLDLEPLEPDAAGPVSQPRRWFADPVTRMLLSHWHGSQTAHVELNAEKCLGVFFDWPGDSLELVASLVQQAEQHWKFRMPQVLVAHAAGRGRAVPVSAGDWRRLIGCEVEPLTVETQEPSLQPELRSEEKEASAPDSKRPWCKTQISVLSRTQQEIGRRRKDQLPLKIAAAAELEQLSPALPGERLMNSWCVEALTIRRSKRQRGLMPSTIKNYLKLLIDHIVDETDDLLKMSPGRLIDRLDDRLAVIQKAGRRHRALTALRSLYRHLSRRRPDLPHFPALLEAHAAEGRSSAKLVSPVEYARALDQCRNADQQICVILGFRCGLRLREILALTAHDFIYDDDIFELRVMRNEYDGLKTPDSRRILPLNRFLEANELELVKKHVLERGAALRVAPGDNLLICRAAAKTGSDSRRPSVGNALAKIISCATFRSLDPHHLRHSFVSYLLATMLLPDDWPDAPVPEQLRSVVSPARKKALAETLLGKEKLGQHSLHAVSATLGHIVSETTIRWYSHLLDLSVLHHVCRPSVEPAMRRDQVRILTGRRYDARSTTAATENAPRKTLTIPSYTAPVATSVDLGGSADLVKVSQWRGRRSTKHEIPFLVGRPREIKAPDLQPKDSTRFKHPDWRHIAPVLLKSPHREAEQLFGAVFKSWGEAAGHVFALRRRSGKFRHELNVEALLQSRKWADYVDTRWRPDRRLTSIERRALFHAIETWDAARSQVRFQSRPLAVAWRDLLISLGFKRDELEISLRGLRFRARPSGQLHAILANAGDLPGTAAMRGRRGSIRISFRGDGEGDRQVRSAGHFLMLLLAIREGYGAAAQS